MLQHYNLQCSMRRPCVERSGLHYAAKKATSGRSCWVLKAAPAPRCTELPSQVGTTTSPVALVVHCVQNAAQAFSARPTSPKRGDIQTAERVSKISAQDSVDSQESNSLATYPCFSETSSATAPVDQVLSAQKTGKSRKAFSSWARKQTWGTVSRTEA